jgi:hypothetical protein
MFRHKTVFVLGAGASFEAGMPLGVQLANRISSLLDIKWDVDGRRVKGENDFVTMLTMNGYSANDIEEISALSNGIRFARSIDEYLDRFKDPATTKLGKLAIAYSILYAEKDSKFSVERHEKDTLETSTIADTWYLWFSHLLFATTDRHKLDRLFGNLTIIDFNYDRCLDQFLRYAIRDAYRLHLADADALLATLTHLRPYGSIGELRTNANPNGVPYGADTRGIDFPALLDGLKTYTEQANSEVVARIKEEFASARTIVFLGFGFHDPNMLLLSPTGKSDIGRILATTKGISESDMGIVQNNIRAIAAKNLVNQNIIVRDLTCAELFKEYRLSLQAA